MKGVRLDVVYAGNLQPGDVIGGEIINGPTRPVSPFAAAWTVGTVEKIRNDDDGRNYVHVVSDTGTSLSPFGVASQLLVMRLPGADAFPPLRFPPLCAEPDPDGTGYGCSLADGHGGDLHIATEDNAHDGDVLAEWSR